jgi:hypothetical protein
MGRVVRVGDHVTVFVTKTVGGNASYVKARPGTVTALGVGKLINCRIGHLGETYTNIDERQDPDENLAATKYIPY